MILGCAPLSAETPVQTEPTLGIPLPQQPELRQRLSAQLTGPEYSVAELTCGDGGTTYVLLGNRDLLAIHHDREIANIERLSR